MKKILCFSGGKDSTAMLIYLLEINAQIDEILYVDVGEWMWDSAKDHIKQVEETLNVKITILDASEEIKDGFQKYGFPSLFNRWCTGIKRIMMRDYLKERYGDDEEIVQYIGYCSDEEKRTGKKLYSSYDVEYPLVDGNITNDDALKLCKKYGFDFGGNYEHHHHYNCWVCPFQKIDELYYIFQKEPKLWNKLREMQFQTDGYYNHGEPIFDYDKKFWKKSCDELREQRLNSRMKMEKEE